MFQSLHCFLPCLSMLQAVPCPLFPIALVSSSRLQYRDWHYADSKDAVACKELLTDSGPT